MVYGAVVVSIHLAVLVALIRPGNKRVPSALYALGPLVVTGLVIAWFGVRLEFMPVALLSAVIFLAGLSGMLIRGERRPPRSEATERCGVVLGLVATVFSLGVFFSFPVRAIPPVPGIYPSGWTPFTAPLGRLESGQKVFIRLYWPSGSGEPGTSVESPFPPRRSVPLPLVWVVAHEGSRMASYERLLESLASHGVAAASFEFGESGFPPSWTDWFGVTAVFDGLGPGAAAYVTPDYFRAVEARRIAFDVARKTLATDGALSGMLDMGKLNAIGVGAGAVVLAGLSDASSGHGTLLLGGGENTRRGVAAVLDGIPDPDGDGSWCFLVSGDGAGEVIPDMDLYSAGDELLESPLAAWFSGRKGGTPLDGARTIGRIVKMFIPASQ